MLVNVSKQLLHTARTFQGHTEVLWTTRQTPFPIVHNYGVTNRQVVLYVGAGVALLLVVAVSIYLQFSGASSAPEENIDDNLEQALEAAVTPPSVAPSANPVKQVLPTANPIDKTNPFKNEYTNPFE